MQPGMRIYEKTLGEFSKPKDYANRQVFTIAITTVPLK